MLKIELVPQLGGRIMNYQLGGHAFLWTNPLLKALELTTKSPAAREIWMNWGGDKVWLAPQGWENEEQWAGPPDPVLDGGCFQIEEIPSNGNEIRIRLTSEPDPRSGVQLSRTLSVQDGSTRLSVIARMTNTSNRIRRWGIWPVTQIDAASRVGDGWNAKLRTCVPLNRASAYPSGYRVIYGSKGNSQYAVADGMVEVRYRHEVGKIGVDSDAGWVATIDGETGNVLVQQMIFEPSAEYPDGASVEVWTNGRGTLTAYGRTEEMPKDVESNPYMLECELVSPFAQLAPGESFEFAYSWAAANVGPDGAEFRRIHTCNEVGCEVEAFQLLKTGEIKGRFGVFYEGDCRVEFMDKDERPVGAPIRLAGVSPLAPLLLKGELVIPKRACCAVLAIYGKLTAPGSKDAGKRIGELARVSL